MQIEDKLKLVCLAHEYKAKISISEEEVVFTTKGCGRIFIEYYERTKKYEILSQFKRKENLNIKQVLDFVKIKIKENNGK